MAPGSTLERWLAKLGPHLPGWVHTLRTAPTAIASRRRLSRRQPGEPCRLVIGAQGRFRRGWIPVEIGVLDVADPAGWARWLDEGEVDALVAEHVWEHLEPDAALRAARLCHRYLAPGARARIAVPDGHHPDPAYRRWVEPGGIGPGAWEHRVLYTVESLTELFERAGFDVRALEHFDASGDFRSVDWDPADGFVRRSLRFDRRNAGGVPRYTSLILDARKPERP